jgi:hypothetical protein
MDKHPKPEIVNGWKIVYPIYRDDLAEATLIPIENFESVKPVKQPAEPQ